MEVIAGIAAWALGGISGDVSGGAVLSSAAGNAVTAAMRLSPLLSPEASVYFPRSAGFANANIRWSEYEAPRLSVAVEVATESDVQQTGKFADMLGLPFLAVTGQHGATSSLDGIDCGVEIDMRRLKSVEIQDDGQTPVIGGGILTKEVVDALWDSGKQTGVCECTSLMGPTLGGGHGWVQGKYDLAIDNILVARVVLANGSLVTVSETSHPDLFWGLRGAGHNFGIVTSVKYRIYDVPENNMLTMQDKGAFACQKKGLAPRFPIGLKEHNVTAERTACNIFNDALKAAPGSNNSVFIHESYSMKRVKSVPAQSTVFSERFNNLLLVANEVGINLRNALVKGSGSSDLYAYVNYAVGDETIHDMYGHEAW